MTPAASGIASGTLCGMAITTEEKVRENRARRAADRQGLELHKSRRRDPRAIDYGDYWLTADGEPVPHTRGDLAHVERYLNGER